MAGRPQKIDWRAARRSFEKLGLSTAAVARKYGVSETSVMNHKRAEGWTREQVVEDLPAETVSSSFAETQTVSVEELPQVKEAQRIAELEAKLREAEERLAQQDAELDKHRPTFELKVYETPEQVREFFGEEKLQEIAGLNLADQSKARVKRGLPPLSYESNPEMIEKEISGTLKEMLTRRTKWIDRTKRCRVVKMAARNPDGTWRAVQVPVEVQLNNEAGQSGAAIWKQRDKGRKLIMPYLCQYMDCWREAAVGPDGKFVYSGYCSPECMSYDPYLQKAMVPGVATSRAVGL